MRKHGTSGLLAALALSLTVTGLGVGLGAADGVRAEVIGPQKTPSVGKQLAALNGSGADRYFGASVAISGTIAVVGDGTSPGGITPLGRVYVFARTAKGWKQTAELKAPARNDGFGVSVAVSGSTIVVGAPEAGSSAFLDGAAYVFTKTATGWKRTGQLKESDPVFDSFDSFGQSVAVSGTAIVVGAPGHVHGSGTGEAYVLAKTTTGWKQAAELKEPGDTNNGFGGSVATSGTIAVVGAPDAAAFAGRVFVFAKTASGWKQTAKLKGSDTVGGDSLTGDQFGRSAAISGTTIVVGAPHHADLRGSLYVFAKTAAGWKQAAEIKGAFPTVELGLVIGVSGKTIVANKGLIGEYVFAKTAAGWKRIATLNRRSDDGLAVAISGALAVVGAQGTTKPGHAYVYQA